MEKKKRKVNDYKINPSTEDWAIVNLTNEIDKGYALQEKKDNITSSDIINFTRSIIVSPDYQREYRFTLEDESKLIESIFLGIPIPPIFLATDNFKGIRVYNVVDGQHRLRALHRFKNNKFKLTNLELLTQLNNSTFNDLSIEHKTEFLSVTLQAIIFKDVPGTDFELEIFNRYNKGTKPLSPQEIRHAVYGSNFNDYVNNFCFSLSENKSPIELFEAYNITKTRIKKKTNQEDIFTILSILEYGINTEFKDSLEYATKYMKEKSLHFKKNKNGAQNNLNKMDIKFKEFNKMIVRLKKLVEYPFSKELYKKSTRRNYKFQVSTSMILAGVFYKLNNLKPEFLNLIQESDESLAIFHNILINEINDSYIESPSYKGSSTNSKEMIKLVSSITEKILAL